MDNTNNTDLAATGDNNISFSDDVSAKSKKSGKGLKVAVIILSVTSFCAIALFVASLVWKQSSEAVLEDKVQSLAVTLANKQEQIENCVTEVPVAPEEPPEEPTLPVTPPIVGIPDNRRYLIITEWGVKMDIPYGLVSMTYKYEAGDNGGLVTLWGRMTEAGFAPGDNSASDFALVEAVFITRSRSSTKTLVSGTIESNFKVGDYHYFFDRTRDGKLPNISAEIVKQQTVALVLSAVYTLTLAQ